MLSRIFVHLGDASNRCLFATAQCGKAQLQPGYNHLRSFKTIRTPRTIKPPFEETGTLSARKLWKPLCFTVAFTGTAFAGAAIWEYERIRNRTYRIIHHYNQYRINRTGWRGEMERWWKSLTEGQKLFVPICFLNVLVFCAWHVPALQSTMMRYFCANPASSAICWPMLLSTFSHYSPIHMMVNMFVLHSFISLIVSALGKEQCLALYLSSGVVASFFSHVYKTAIRRGGPSVGASGAVMGVIAFVCCQFPNTQLSIVFLPHFTFSAGVALKALMAIDLTGVILRWRYFDHAAHLGGALFGIFWQMYGSTIWRNREPLLTFWHELRGPPNSKR